MIIELHLLQSFPVSNLNRDDIGQPKTVRFGGVTRARISSQSLKRAARELFTSHGLETGDMGRRTKQLPERAGILLAERGKCEVGRGQLVAQEALAAFGFGVTEDRGRSEYLLYVGPAAVEHLADYCEKRWDILEKALEKEEKRKANPKKTARTKVKLTKTEVIEARKVFDSSRVADIALFGRMIADNQDFSVISASQVAHSISTHAVANEFDFYTAMDDMRPAEEPAADMMGTIDYNAACYYRYANLDTDRLLRNLFGEESVPPEELSAEDKALLVRSVRAWLRAFVHAVPRGKQNSMAARTVPDVLLGVARTDGAWSLANAFLSPIGDVADLMDTSAQRMAGYFDQIRDFYGDEELRGVHYGSLRPSGGLSDRRPRGCQEAKGIDAFVEGLISSAGL
ncbi:type I-E CRISPR-associated protein Cas7/Cse4/CasC [Streptomyces sp. AFD10]|uniref:type I-E CRISPR-associated protein Cas7/Cse4/CasC n=1 Tax=Streptomyces sp. AFD10 TaxID=3050948 RepID=UPI0034E00F5C